MSGHTKGPWKWLDRRPESYHSENEGLIVSGDEIVCDFGDNEAYYNTAGTRPSDADIALICAAPEMLAALQSIASNDTSASCSLIARNAIAKAVKS